MEQLNRALEIMRTRNGEHELVGIKSLDRGEIDKYLKFSARMMNQGNYRIREYHRQVRDALTALVAELDTL